VKTTKIEIKRMTDSGMGTDKGEMDEDNADDENKTRDGDKKGDTSTRSLERHIKLQESSFNK